MKGKDCTVIKVGLCNIADEQEDHIKNMLEDIISRYDAWEIERYSLDSLKTDIKEHSFDCQLLMIDLFEADDEIRDILENLDSENIRTDIIYLTESQNRVFECYRNRAYAYILKPMHDSDIRREIDRYFKEININQKYIRITFGGSAEYIPIDNIQYVESDHRKVYIYTTSKKYEYYSRLDDLEAELKQEYNGDLKNEHFIRCHQSYLVAVAYITKHNNESVTVAGKTIPVSRKYRQAVQSAMYQAEILNSRDKDGHIRIGMQNLVDIKGSIICVKGEYIGKVVRLVPEKTVIVGRSGETADVIVNLPQVSRKHCMITYHEKEDYYEVQDCSTNGTFVDGGEPLRRGDIYAVKPGTDIVFGDDRYRYKLG